MPMTEQQWTALAHYLQELLPRAAPDWTTNNSHDPGITVLGGSESTPLEVDIAGHEPLHAAARLVTSLLQGALHREYPLVWFLDRLFALGSLDGLGRKQTCKLQRHGAETG